MEEGDIVELQEDLENNMNSYFANLLEEWPRDRDDTQREVLRHIPNAISEENKLMLGKLIKMEEVEATIK